VSKLPPFTLVYQTESGEHPKGSEEISETVKAIQPLEMNADLQQTLVSSLAFAAEPREQQERNLRTVIDDLKRADVVETVALWDLDARAGHLPEVISALNKSQPVFTLFELQGAPLPAALISRNKYVVAWVRDRLKKQGRRLSKADREAIEDNLIVNDFYRGARVIHKRIGVTYLIGITQSMLAGDEGDGPFWNYFSTSDDRILMVSTYDLRRFARKAGRAFEVALAMLIVGQLMVAVNTDLNFHDGEDTGCLFDMNIVRENVVACIRELKIDEECFNKMIPKYREAALAMLEALREFRIDDEPGPPQTDIDEAHWLNELDKLGEE